MTSTGGIAIGSGGGNLFDGKTIALSSMPNGTVMNKNKSTGKWAHHTKNASLISNIKKPSFRRK